MDTIYFDYWDKKKNSQSINISIVPENEKKKSKLYHIK